MVILFVLGLILVGTALMLLSMATRSEAETSGINKSLAVLEAMSGAFDLRVPLEVNMAHGASWAAAKG